MSVTPVRDFNGDGIGDLKVRVGETRFFADFLIYGRRDGSFNVDLTRLNPEDGYRLPGNGRDMSAPRVAGVTATTGGEVAPTVTLLKDANTRPVGIFTESIGMADAPVYFDGTIYFGGFHPDTGTELYRLNGSVPELVADLVPGPSGATPHGLAVLGDELLFFAITPEFGYSLYITDGTSVTRLSGLTNSWAYIFDSAPKIVGNTAYFLDYTEPMKPGLMKYDGTTISTVTVGDVPVTGVLGLVPFGDDLLYYRDKTGSLTGSLHVLKADGTEIELDPDVTLYNLFATYLSSVEINGTMYLTGFDQDFNSSIYSYDGTNLTRLDLMVSEDVAVMDPAHLMAIGNKLYFVGSTVEHGTELMSWDGTSITVHEVTPGEEGTDIWEPIAFDGRIFFSVYDDVAEVDILMVFDGTTISEWSEIDAGMTFLEGIGYRVTPDGMYFKGWDIETGAQIFRITGNTSARITSQLAGTHSSDPEEITVVGDRLFAGLHSWQTDDDLFFFDGTTAHTPIDIEATEEVQVYDEVRNFTALGNKTYFTVDLLNSFESSLWELNDGTPVRVEQPTYGNIAVYGHKLFYWVTGTNGGLWATDGLTTSQVDAASTTELIDAEWMTVYNDKLYFTASSDEFGNELLVTDGQTISLAQDIHTGPDSSTPHHLIVWNDKLYFLAQGNDDYEGLYEFDGTTLRKVFSDVWTNCGWYEKGCLVPFNGRLYFAGGTATTGQDVNLWSTSGSAPTMHTSAEGGLDISNLASFDGKLYFQATGASGAELYAWNGTQADLVVDIYPGFYSSEPAALTVYKDRLYFAATTPDKGREVYSIAKGSGVATEGLEAASGTGISAVWPNPVQDRAKVNVTLAKASDVRIEIYDLLGRKVLVPIDATLEAGTHPVTIEAGLLPSGIYFCRMTAEGRSFLQKFVVTR